MEASSVLARAARLILCFPPLAPRLSASSSGLKHLMPWVQHGLQKPENLFAACMH